MTICGVWMCGEGTETLLCCDESGSQVGKKMVLLSPEEEMRSPEAVALPPDIHGVFASRMAAAGILPHDRIGTSRTMALLPRVYILKCLKYVVQFLSDWILHSKCVSFVESNSFLSLSLRIIEGLLCGN